MSKLTRKDLLKARNRWTFMANIAFNYETMQSTSVINAIGPCLEKIYDDDPEGLQKSLHSHFKFFNTQPWMGEIILSAALAIEEEGGSSAEDAVRGVKTSLMGPFAGLGDSIFFVLPKTIFGAIASYMALEGNPIGLLICLGFSLIMLSLRFKMWDIGYNQGVKFVTSMQEKLSNLTDAASVMGLVVVGAMIASNVKATIPYTFIVGETAVTIQSVLDSIMPNFLPLTVTLIVYWLFGKKGMTSTKMVWLIIAISVVGAFLGILG
ncbi:MAG: PTS system mannose/fructose/sorbose family transporter subunit IID [Erysipelotrichaceae bacterium]